MERVTVSVARGLSVSFSSTVVSQSTYHPLNSPCSSCSTDCGSAGCSVPHSLTVHQVSDGVLLCESSQGTRSLSARFVVTDHDGDSEYVALRAFKDRTELLDWAAATCSQHPSVHEAISTAVLEGDPGGPEQLQ